MIAQLISTMSMSLRSILKFRRRGITGVSAGDFCHHEEAGAEFQAGAFRRLRIHFKCTVLSSS